MTYSVANCPDDVFMNIQIDLWFGRDLGQLHKCCLTQTGLRLVLLFPQRQKLIKTMCVSSTAISNDSGRWQLDIGLFKQYEE